MHFHSHSALKAAEEGKEAPKRDRPRKMPREGEAELLSKIDEATLTLDVVVDEGWPLADDGVLIMFVFVVASVTSAHN
jgi:hypothetical protein